MGHFIAFSTSHTIGASLYAVGRGLGDVNLIVRYWVDLSVWQLIVHQLVPFEVFVRASVLPIFNSDKLRRILVDPSSWIDFYHGPHAVPVFVRGIQDLEAETYGKVLPRISSIGGQITLPLLVSELIRGGPMVQVKPDSIAIVIDGIGVVGVLPRRTIVLATHSVRCKW